MSFMSKRLCLRSDPLPELLSFSLDWEKCDSVVNISEAENLGVRGGLELPPPTF